MRFSPFLFAALSACVAGPTERPLSVRQVIENAQALDGREITVAGWIQACRHLSCSLHASAEEAGRERPVYFLSIGRSGWFDAFARRNAPARIALRARVDARCITDPASGIIAACTDRPASLDPRGLVR
jgi:hypothetical protein